MLNPNDPLDIQVEKQARIIDALIRRSNRSPSVGGSAFSLFQSAVALQGEVWAKTKDLERALDTLGQASNQLEVAEVAREQTQRSLAEALNAMEGGFALFVEERLQVCNDLFRNLLPDISDDVLPGLPFKEYFRAVRDSDFLRHEPRLEETVRPSPTLERSGKMASSFVIATKNDRWYQITHQRTSPENTVVLQTDISDVVRQNRRETNRLIDAQADFVQAAFDHMTSGICTFSPDGLLRTCNARFGSLLGLPSIMTRDGISFGLILTFLRQNRLFVGSAAAHEDLSTWMSMLRRRGSVEARVRHAAGLVLDIHVHGLPDGGFIVNVNDVTVESLSTEALERRVAERTTELTEANKRLRQQYETQAKVEEELLIAKEEAERAVSSKTRFLAAASHDLLQPINAAKLLISTLREQSKSTTLEDTVGRLGRSFRSIESLLHALLDISRLDSVGSAVQISKVSLNEILHSVKEEYAPLAAEKGLRLDIVPCDIWVKSDPRYLARSVQNLVVNAIQYTETGRVLVGCRRRGDKVELQVWDTGIGIPKEHQNTVFEEFARVDNRSSTDGMGLGLSIVQRASAHLNHAISLRSKVGVGSVFSLEMPTTLPDTAELTGMDPDPTVDESEMDLIVLVVENDADVLFATIQRLESWGASVLGAKSTAEALVHVAELGMPPDIILADYQLDDGDNGIETIRQIRCQTGSMIPAIMITADRGKDLIKASHENRFTVLTKPVQLSRLRPLIDWKTRVRSPADALLTDKSIA